MNLTNIIKNLFKGNSSKNSQDYVQPVSVESSQGYSLQSLNKNPNASRLRNYYQDILDEYRSQGRVTYLSVEESRAINERLAKAMKIANMKAKVKQYHSRIESAKIVLD